jgi:zinc transport system permease protein
MRNAMAAIVLASIACGIIGVYVVVRRIVFMSGGIAHASFGGIGLGYFLGIDPIIAVIPFSLASALAMGFVSTRTRTPLDTAIGMVWALGMALGVLLVSLAPGYAPDLFSYLFGNILTVPTGDLVIMGFLGVIIVAVVVLFYRKLLAFSFDEEFARATGMNTELLNVLLLCLVALAVVVLIRIVGIILVIVLLAGPAAVARQLTHSLAKMMAIAVAFSVLFGVVGLFLSFYLDIPSGATIVLVTGAGFGLATLGRYLMQKWTQRTRLCR